jgi:5-methylcytosine-specific restriction enzyme subunit McrC
MDVTTASGGNGHSPYEVEEHGVAEVPIADLLDEYGNLSLNPDVEKKGYFTVQLTKKGLRLRARGYIGLIPLNDKVTIDVVPRVPVSELERLLRVSEHIPDLLFKDRPYAFHGAENASLFDLFAEVLLARTETIAAEGMLHDYKRNEIDTSFPRGRILMAETVTRLQARGLTHKVASSWFERSVDTAANRCLKYALLLVAGRLEAFGQLYGKRRALLLKAASLYEMFGEVTLDHALDFLRDPSVTGMRELPSVRDYYRPALSVARMICAQASVGFGDGSPVLSLPSLLIDMSKVFEEYLRTILARASERNNWEYDVLDGNFEGKKDLFNQPPSVEATPDIVIWDQQAAVPRLIIEVKNVPLKKTTSERDAIEQVVTYGESYGCSCLVLAHPRAEGQEFTGLRLQGEIGRHRLYQYVFDLSAASVAEDSRFTDAIFGLLRADPSVQLVA